MFSRLFHSQNASVSPPTTEMTVFSTLSYTSASQFSYLSNIPEA